MEIVEAAALLHDAQGGDLLQDERADRHELSAEFAKQVLEQEGWAPERIEAVQHCIAAHRYRGGAEPQSLEAKVLFDADKLDVLGAFGVARTIAYAVEAKQPVYAPPSQQFVETGEKEEGEPHSAYHEYLFKLRHVGGRLHTESAHAMAQERQRLLTSFFEALAAETEIVT